MSVSIGELVASLELDNTFSKDIEKAEKDITDFDKAWGNLKLGAGLAAGAIAGAAATLMELGKRGADVSDVTETFNTLQARIGNTSGVLGVLTEAFDGVVSQFDIMKATNTSLQLGLKLTEDQFKTTAMGARLLADRTGTDVTQAYTMLATAMSTGRDRQLRHIGLQIDSAAAAEKFAASLGKTTGQLTKAEKAQVTTQAVLAALKSELEVSGRVAMDFGDRVAQLTSTMSDLYDMTALVTSSVLMEFDRQLREAGITGVETRNIWGDTLNVMANGFVNMSAIVLNAIKQLVSIFTGFGATTAAVAGQIWDALSFKTNPADALKNIAAIGGAALKSLETDVKDLTKVTVTWTDYTKVSAGAVKGLAKPTTDLTGDLKAQEAAFKKLVDQMKTHFDAASKSREANEGLMEILGPGAQEATIQMGRLADATDRLGGVSDLTDQQLISLVEQLQAQIRLGGENEEGFKKLAEAMGEAGNRSVWLNAQLGILAGKPPEIATAMKDVTEKTIDWQNAIEGVIFFADMLGGPFEDLAQVVSGTNDAFARMREGIEAIDADTKMDEATKSGEKLKLTITAVATAAGLFGSMLSKSTNPALAKMGGALSGAAAGAKMGAAFGPWGAAIGAAAGAVFGFISAAKKLKKELVDIKTKFLESVGGIDALKLSAATAGVSIDGIFQAKSKDKLLKAIDEVKAKLATWDEANEKLQAAIDKYGITVEELGPKWAQQEMDKRALQLYEEWQLLSAAGVEINTLIEKMGPSLLDFVNQSLAAGTAIPLAMKPMIDKFWEAGALLHEDGTAFTEAEYKALNFGATTTEMFATLIEKIDKLVNALLGIPDVTTTVTVHTKHTSDGGGDGGDGGDPKYPEMAAGGIVTRPTLAYIGESGPEAVIPLDQLDQQQIIHIPLSIDSKVIADVLVRRNRAGLFQIVTTG